MLAANLQVSRKARLLDVEMASKMSIVPWLDVQWVSVVSQYAKIMGSTPCQGAFKSQPMNA